MRCPGTTLVKWEDECCINRLLRTVLPEWCLVTSLTAMNEWEWQLLEEKATLNSVLVGDRQIKTGDSVRLKPRVGADVFDLALANKIAIIESIEEDYEGRVHLAVVLDDDPGKDLGLLRQPGHRFFFSVEEVEPL